jgi:class 3 adenylate cyclase
MHKILFVDNKVEEYERFLKLPFAQEHISEIVHLQSPVKLRSLLLEDREREREIRLIILDLLWEEDGGRKPLPLGVEAMQELSEIGPDIPIVIYSVLDDDDTLHNLIPEMMRLGAYDWVGKAEPKNLRSFRFERAYMAGRDVLNRPASRAILPPDQQQRSNVHVAVMFVDMSGFTALTSQVGAESVVKILKSFYSVVGEPIISNEGYIDKYIGDAVMAVFGASTEQKQGSYGHVQSCIQAAKQIQSRAMRFRMEEVEPVLRKQNLQWSAEQTRNIGKFRIGVESGAVEIIRFERGNESELTFIGTPVNIAARILNKGEAGEVWIGENACSNGALFDDVDNKQVDEYKNLPGIFQRYQLRV